MLSVSAYISFNTLWIYTALKLHLSTFCACKVSIPSEFTLLSNQRHVFYKKNLFQYPLNLHCSQTPSGKISKKSKFQYPLNLHCSQTILISLRELIGFNTLWIYTALKHRKILTKIFQVSIPSEFTLLSNPAQLKKWFHLVSIPSEFTLLSNTLYSSRRQRRFQYPLNLHCSQTQIIHKTMVFEVSIPSEFTLLSNLGRWSKLSNEFQYPLNLHCSQTLITSEIELCQFQYPLNLHCSQTKLETWSWIHGFQYPLNLHCSQTVLVCTTVWNWFQYPLNLHCSQTP